MALSAARSPCPLKNRELLEPEANLRVSVDVLHLMHLPAGLKKYSPEESTRIFGIALLLPSDRLPAVTATARW